MCLSLERFFDELGEALAGHDLTWFGHDDCNLYFRVVKSEVKRNVRKRCGGWGKNKTKPS